MKRWIKMPGPGEFRGMGVWEEFDAFRARSGIRDTYWEECRQTGFLPTHVGEEPPADDPET